MIDHGVDQAIVARERIGLATAGLSVRHERSIVSADYRGHERPPDLLEDVSVGRFRREYAVEAEGRLPVLVVTCVIDSDGVTIHSATRDTAAASLGHCTGIQVSRAAVHLHPAVALADILHVEHG